jgi:hypothetical protein
MCFDAEARLPHYKKSVNNKVFPFEAILTSADLIQKKDNLSLRITSFIK